MGKPRVICWCGPDQAELVGAIVARAGAEVVLAGAPASRDTADVAKALGAERADDLRATLASAEADAVLLGDCGEFGAGGEPADAAAVAQAHARGAKVLTLDPAPASALELTSGAWKKNTNGAVPADIVRPLGLFGRTSALARSPEILENFGAARFAAVEMWAPTGAGTLGGRLFDGLELLSGLMGECERIDAAHATADRSEAAHVLAGESLRGLRGEMTANLRFDDGRAASLVVGVGPGAGSGWGWRRRCTLLGERGRLTVDDGGFVWIDEKGAKADESGEPGTGGRDSVEVLGAALERALDGAVPASAPVAHEGVLTLAQAALLSCRTGQGESPAMIRRMMLSA